MAAWSAAGLMPRGCSICGEAGHDCRDHVEEARSRSMEAGRLAYEETITFAEAGRRLGISRQAAYRGWRRYVQVRDLQKS